MTYRVKNTGPGATMPPANSYVMDLGYVADVQHGDGLVQATFPALPDEAGDAIVVGQPNAVGKTCAAPWGQSVDVSAGTDEAIEVHGYDYLGQPMVEAMTVSTGTATGAKAFKWVTKVVGTVGDQTLNWGAELGLPYAMKSEADAAATGTAADITSPATNATGDPRGTVTFTATPDGTTRLFTYTPYRPDVDAAPLSMHGVRHFYPATT